MSATKTPPHPAALLATAFAASLSAGIVSAASDGNPFAMSALENGYRVAANEQRQEPRDEEHKAAVETMKGLHETDANDEDEKHARKSGKDKSAEGKCGEGKCGGTR